MIDRLMIFLSIQMSIELFNMKIIDAERKTELDKKLN